MLIKNYYNDVDTKNNDYSFYKPLNELSFISKLYEWPAIFTYQIFSGDLRK